jgi:hypothetical protein
MGAFNPTLRPVPAGAAFPRRAQRRSLSAAVEFGAAPSKSTTVHQATPAPPETEADDALSAVVAAA